MLFSAPWSVPCSKVSWNSRPRRKAASESQFLFALIQSKKENFALFISVFPQSHWFGKEDTGIEKSGGLGFFVTCKILLMVFADVDSMCSELHIFAKPQ